MFNPNRSGPLDGRNDQSRTSWSRGKSFSQGGSNSRVRDIFGPNELELVRGPDGNTRVRRTKSKRRLSSHSSKSQENVVGYDRRYHAHDGVPSRPKSRAGNSFVPQLTDPGLSYAQTSSGLPPLEVSRGPTGFSRPPTSQSHRPGQRFDMSTLDAALPRPNPFFPPPPPPPNLVPNGQLPAQSTTHSGPAPSLRPSSALKTSIHGTDHPEYTRPVSGTVRTSTPGMTARRNNAIQSLHNPLPKDLSQFDPSNLLNSGFAPSPTSQNRPPFPFQQTTFDPQEQPPFTEGSSNSRVENHNPRFGGFQSLDNASKSGETAGMPSLDPFNSTINLKRDGTPHSHIPNHAFGSFPDTQGTGPPHTSLGIGLAPPPPPPGLSRASEVSTGMKFSHPSSLAPPELSRNTEASGANFLPSPSQSPRDFSKVSDFPALNAVAVARLPTDFPRANSGFAKPESLTGRTSHHMGGPSLQSGVMMDRQSSSFPEIKQDRHAHPSATLYPSDRTQYGEGMRGDAPSHGVRPRDNGQTQRDRNDRNVSSRQEYPARVRRGRSSHTRYREDFGDSDGYDSPASQEEEYDLPVTNSIRRRSSRPRRRRSREGREYYEHMVERIRYGSSPSSSREPPYGSQAHVSHRIPRFTRPGLSHGLSPPPYRHVDPTDFFSPPESEFSGTRHGGVTNSDDFWRAN